MRALVFSLLAFGCSSAVAPMGDPSYQTATLCVADPNLRASVATAAAEWNQAAGTSIKVAATSDDCGAVVEYAHLALERLGESTGGNVLIDPDKHPEFEVEAVTHEVGHLLIGHWHSSDEHDIMFFKIHADMAITADDISKIGKYEYQG